MASDRTESDTVLASLKAKVVAWQLAVDSYLAAKALEGAAADGGSSPTGRGGPLELPVNAFRGMTMSEAIKLLLKSVQRKQTPAEIVAGLQHGGFVTTAKDIGPTLRSALAKLKADGVLLRFSDGWDLAEAHSAMIRHRLTKENEKARKQPKKGKAKVRSSASKSASKAETTLDDRAGSFLRAHATEAFTAKEIATALGLPDASKLILSLSRMVRYKKATKTTDGRFSIMRAA